MLPEMCLVQCRLDLFDIACEDVCYDSLSVHDFARCRYCVPDTCEVHGLVQSNDSLYHANADLRGVARHKESAWIRAPLGPAGASRWTPPNPGPHNGPNETGAGAEPKPPCAREQIPLPGRQMYSRLHKSALLRHRKEGGCTSD